MQVNAPSNHGSQAEKSGQVENVRPDDDPSTDRTLMVDQGRDCGGDLGRISRQGGQHAEERL